MPRHLPLVLLAISLFLRASATADVHEHAKRQDDSVASLIELDLVNSDGEYYTILPSLGAEAGQSLADSLGSGTYTLQLVYYSNGQTATQTQYFYVPDSLVQQAGATVSSVIAAANVASDATLTGSDATIATATITVASSTVTTATPTTDSTKGTTRGGAAATKTTKRSKRTTTTTTYRSGVTSQRGTVRYRSVISPYNTAHTYTPAGAEPGDDSSSAQSPHVPKTLVDVIVQCMIAAGIASILAFGLAL